MVWWICSAVKEQRSSFEDCGEANSWICCLGGSPASGCFVSLSMGTAGLMDTSGVGRCAVASGG